MLRSRFERLLAMTLLRDLAGGGKPAMPRVCDTAGRPVAARAVGRGLHSSSFRLNVGTFCGMRWLHDVPPVY